MKTNRRQFLGNLFKTVAVAIVAPSVIAQVESIKPQIIVGTINGHTYWFDHAMWLAEKQFMEELEHRYFGRAIYSKKYTQISYNV